MAQIKKFTIHLSECHLESCNFKDNGRLHFVVNCCLLSDWSGMQTHDLALNIYQTYKISLE